MRLVLLQDFKITEEESNELQRQFIDFYYEHTKIVPEFYVEKMDYSSYPTYIDSDGDKRPTKEFLKEVTDEIHSRYNEFGTDHVVFLIHEDNWLSDTDTTKGIWGTSYSNIFHSYHVQYCRFDRDNIANSFGTLYHEVMHSHDALIATTLNIDINKLGLGFTSWDKEVIHGNSDNFKYIRYNENYGVLKAIGPYLYQSYEKRRSLHMKDIGLMKSIITLLQKLIVIYRSRQNKKDGVPRT